MTALSVQADLTLERGGETFSITGDGDTVVIDAPTLAAAARLRTAFTRLRDTTATVPRSLPTDADLTFDVRVRGARVARLDPGGSPGLVSSLVGATPARVCVRGVALAVLRALRP